MSKTLVRTPSVAFARKSSPATEDGDVIRRRGVIFRAGVYPTQAYAMSPDDLRALVAEFSPVPVDAGHPQSASPLDGKLGTLEAVEVSDDGTTLFGTVALPRWLESALGDARRRVSASFDRATRRLRSLSLVTHPQIEEAELQAAFACACGGDHHANAEEETPMEAWKVKALADLEAMDEDERGPVLAALGGEAPDMDLYDDHDDNPDDLDDTDDDAPDAGTSDFAEDPEKAELRRRLEALEDERRRERSAAFAKDEVRAGRITPAEEAIAADVLFAAMTDDALGGADLVHFSRGSKAVTGTREQMVRSAYAQRPAHRWGQALIPGDRGAGGTAEFAGARPLDHGGDPPESEAEYARRLVAKYNGRNRIAGR